MIRSFNRLASPRNFRSLYSTAAKSSACLMPVRSNQFSTIIEKAKGEEASYFKKQDELKKAQLRAEFEALLAKTESNDEKAQEVLELVGRAIVYFYFTYIYI